MPEYPIRVSYDGYGGRDPARLRKTQRFNRAAERIERFLNEQMAAEEPGSRVFSYGTIARDLGLDRETVKDVLFAIGGDNGITIVKRS